MQVREHRPTSDLQEDKASQSALGHSMALVAAPAIGAQVSRRAELSPSFISIYELSM